MLDLSRITLVAMGSTNIRGNVLALKHSMRNIKFGKVKFVTSAPNEAKEQARKSQIDICEIEPIRSIDEWNFHIIYSLGDYIDTDFALLVHPDGYVVNPQSWRDEFYDYDYIGAPWPLPKDDYSYRDKKGEVIRVGNSVSLRSKGLIDLAPKLNLEWKAFYGFYNEDGFITVNNRHHYIEAGMRFAPIEVAKYFSREMDLPENADIESPFCFHLHKSMPGRNIKYKNYEA